MKKYLRSLLIIVTIAIAVYLFNFLYRLRISNTAQDIHMHDTYYRNH